MIGTQTPRLGFAAKIVGAPIKTSDNRRPPSGPHLRHSLAMLHEVLGYMGEHALTMFRLPSNLCPYGTAPKFPELRWEGQFAEAAAELAGAREHAQRSGVRLSFHPGQYTVLNSPHEAVVAAARDELELQCRLLDELGAGPEAVVLIHVGGVYGDRAAARERMLREIEAMPDVVRRRFCLENDDVSWPAADVLEICRTAGVPMIFDFHHHDGLNSGEPWEEMLAGALSTWPDDVTPKTHFSTPRDPLAPPGSPDFRAHADLVDPLRAAAAIEAPAKLGLRPYDVMLEAKSKDLAVLALRDALAARAPGAPQAVSGELSAPGADNSPVGTPVLTSGRRPRGRRRR